MCRLKPTPQVCIILIVKYYFIGYLRGVVLVYRNKVVIIEQSLVDIDVCRRKNHWQSEHYYLGDEVFFDSIDLRLSLTEIYLCG